MACTDDLQTVRFQIMASQLSPRDSLIMKFSQPHPTQVSMKRSSVASSWWVSEQMDLPVGKLISYTYSVLSAEFQGTTEAGRPASGGPASTRRYQFKLKAGDEVIDDGKFEPKDLSRDWGVLSQNTQCSEGARLPRHQAPDCGGAIGPERTNSLAAAAGLVVPGTNTLSSCLDSSKPSCHWHATLGENTSLAGLRKAVDAQLAGFREELQACVTMERLQELLNLESCRREQQACADLHRLEGLCGETRLQLQHLQGEVKSLAETVQLERDLQQQQLLLGVETNGRLAKLEELATEQRQASELQKSSIQRLEGEVECLLREMRVSEVTGRLGQLEGKMQTVSELQQSIQPKFENTLDEVRSLQEEVHHGALPGRLDHLQKEFRTFRASAFRHVKDFERTRDAQQTQLDSNQKQIMNLRVDRDHVAKSLGKLAAKQRPALQRLGALEGAAKTLHAGVEDIRATMAAEVEGLHRQLQTHVNRERLVVQEDLRAVQDLVEGVQGQLMPDMAARLASLEDMTRRQQQQQHQHAWKDEATEKLEMEMLQQQLATGQREVASLRRQVSDVFRQVGDVHDRLDLLTQEQEKKHTPPEKDRTQAKEAPHKPQEKEAPHKPTASTEPHRSAPSEESSNVHRRAAAAAPGSEQEAPRRHSATEGEKGVPHTPETRRSKEQKEQWRTSGYENGLPRRSFFNFPPHPTETRSRQITIGVESKLLRSLEVDTHSARASLLKRLYLEVHPDKGGTEEAFQWWTAWKRTHQDWFLKDEQMVKQCPSTVWTRENRRPWPH